MFVLAKFYPKRPRNVRVPTDDLYAHIVLNRPRLSSSDGPLVWYALSRESLHSANTHKQILVPSRINPRQPPSLTLRRKVGHCVLLYKAA